MGVGYLPQEPSVFRGMSVQSNILAVLEVFVADLDQRQHQLEVLLVEFGLEHIRHNSVLSLSGGERRRVEIARSLAASPQYILLDEPLAGIDPIAVDDVRKLITQLVKRGIGVLITDHNVRDTLAIVSRAYIIYDGVVLMEGTPKEIIANKKVREIYLGETFVR
jgi:lipopolysaccharide export system ATP-binding protein